MPRRKFLAPFFGLAALGLALSGTLVARAAQTVVVWAGAESADMAVQIEDFIPKPVTINVGDTVTWKLASTEFHTVSFLSGAPVPDFVSVSDQGPVVNPAAAFPTTPNRTTYDGTGIASSGLLNKGQTYSLTFTKAGTFNYVCIVHPPMTAQVVVKDAGQPADTAAAVEAKIDTHIANDLATRALPMVLAASTEQVVQTPTGDLASGVTAGAGDGHADVMRFLPGNVTIRAGELVSWTNIAMGTPHTVTFLAGADKPEVIIPVPQPGGPPMLTLNFAVLLPTGGPNFDGSEMANSGFLGMPPESMTDSYALRFTQPGLYEYTCILHDNMGMKGTVTVLP